MNNVARLYFLLKTNMEVSLLWSYLKLREKSTSLNWIYEV